MVQLDRELLFDARRFVNGANVHFVKQTIFCYEEAVYSANEGAPYKSRFEDLLRRFVKSERTRRRIYTKAETLRARSADLNAISAEMNNRITAFFQNDRIKRPE